MTETAKQANGVEAGMAVDHANPLPGTTKPEHSQPEDLPSEDAQSPPKSLPGPTVKGKATTTTIYEPSQLAFFPRLPALVSLINEAFRDNHTRENIMPASIDRLQSSAQYLQQMGTDLGTFAYILSWSDNGEPIGTAGCHRYVAPVLVADGAKEPSAFSRLKLPNHIPEGAEIWELKLMAVDLAVHRQGLASYLMNLVDEEVKRRVRGSYPKSPLPPTYMVLTTAKEANEHFYRRKGYQDDYETRQEAGYMGSPNGFGVLHMSRALEL